MEESGGIGLFGRVSNLFVGVLLLEELVGVILHLTLAGARPVRESRWSQAGLTTLHSEQNLSFVVSFGGVDGCYIGEFGR